LIIGKRGGSDGEEKRKREGKDGGMKRRR